MYHPGRGKMRGNGLNSLGLQIQSQVADPSWYARQLGLNYYPNVILNVVAVATNPLVLAMLKFD